MSETLMCDTRSRGGITFTIKVVSDPYDQPDLSWLGEYTDETADVHGCGKRHVRHSYDDRTYKFFCPSFGCDSRPWKEIAADNGWSKDEFFAAAKRDHEIMNDWWECYVIVEADLGPLGTAMSSLSGLNWNGDEEYITNDIVDEVIREAEYEAESILFRSIMGGNVNLMLEEV